MTHYQPVDEVLRELGVTDPQEIDVEAIAWHLGARVKYRRLDGCEARIAGNGDQAIISVDQRSSDRRKRFSVAHELGHWKFHRGRILACRCDEIGRSGENYPETERVANLYASRMLMPAYLLDPVARDFPKLTFKTIDAISDRFDTSMTATAIRLVEGGHAPSALICHGPKGRKWFTRSPGVPDRWFPQDQLDHESYAFSILFGSHANDPHPRKIGADAWFDRDEASRYEVQEQTIRIAGDEVLTLVLIQDPNMLEDWGRSRRPVTRKR